LRQDSSEHTFHPMSIDVLKKELAGLGEGERSGILAFLVALQDEKNAGYRETLARKIDDRDAQRWVTLEELDRRLAEKSK
jgi:hypothetical protein